MADGCVNGRHLFIDGALLLSDLIRPKPKMIL